MLNHALKNLSAHRLRLALTAIAVVLGVAFMAGTLVLTSTLKHNIDGLFQQATSGYDVVVRATTPYGSAGTFGGSGQGSNSRPLTPETLLPTIRSTSGVAAADGSVQGNVTLVGANGKALTSHGGAPSIAFAWSKYRQLSPFKLRSGRGPVSANEMTIDANSASKHHLALGQSVTVIGNGAPKPFTIVGIFGFGSSSTVAGATVAGFEPSVAQELVGRPGYYNQIEVASTSGTNTDSLVSAIAAHLPSGYEAVSSTTVSQEDASSVNSFLTTFNDFLLSFAFIALFVGAFLIFNTFSILVGQRTRELALLRALGASRRQVTSSVVIEATLTGLAGSIAGLIVGIGLATIFVKAFRHLLDLSSTGLVITAGTVILSLVVGTLITVVSALGPSFRASRVPPVAAMRDDAVIAETSLRRRAILGGVVTVAGLAGLFAGLANGSGIALVGAAAGATFIGIAMLVPFVAAPLARGLAAPVAAVAGVTGRLSRENAARNPRRTAATSATLMIGLALVAAIATLASSANASFGALFTSTVKSDYVVTASGSSNNGFSTSAEPVVRSAAGVTLISPFTEVQFHIGNASHMMSAIDPVTGPQLVNIDIVTGSVSALAAGRILVDNTVANDDHLAVGDPITMGFPSTGNHTFIVGGTYKTNQFLDNYLAPIDVALANTNQPRLEAILVKVAQPSAAAQSSLEQALSSFPQLQVQTTAQFIDAQKSSIQAFLRIVYVLLGLSILIALIGVVNTLLLSVLERTHEIGLLRAVGMGRGQVRAMIRGEAVVVSVLGALLGLVIGVGLGAALVHALGGSGISRLVIPWTTIVIVLILAIIFGVFAAIFPARRAARLDVLQAVSTV